MRHAEECKAVGTLLVPACQPISGLCYALMACIWHLLFTSVCLFHVIPVIKKEPITAEILQKLHDKFVTEDAGLPIICTMAICLLGYSGFFCFNEIASLKERDVNSMKST